MNKQIYKTLNRLCGETETLQNRVDKSKHREIYEAIAKAKNSLLDAILAADELLTSQK
jgi:triphosphoribosyl-dephospho-CoA synthetase